MSGTTRQSTARRGGRRPASLADGQLAHLESVMEHVARGDASGASYPLDYEYWEKRVRELDETYELITSQRQRIAKLLERLVSEAQIRPKRRTAA